MLQRIQHLLPFPPNSSFLAFSASGAEAKMAEAETMLTLKEHSLQLLVHQKIGLSLLFYTFWVIKLPLFEAVSRRQGKMHSFTLLSKEESEIIASIFKVAFPLQSSVPFPLEFSRQPESPCGIMMSFWLMSVPPGDYFH